MTEHFYRHPRPGDHPQPDMASGPGLRPGRMVGIAGAMTSLALIVGLGIWGYRLAVRDVQGIPVVRALEGPARALPEDPGGQLSRHTGLAVNDVAAEGTAAAPAERIALAPAPAELAPEAAPMGELSPEPELSGLPRIGGQDTPADEDGPTIATPAALDPTEGFSLAPDAEEETPDLATSTEAEDPAPTTRIEAIPASVPGVARSPRPPVRPEIRLAALDSATASTVAPDAAGEPEEGDAVAAAVAAAVAEAIAAPGPARELDPASLAPGTSLAQIGAFDDPETARGEWAAVEEDFAALMAGKSRVIEPAESGGRTFYRLRVAGFDDSADAQRFCAALLAEGTACIPAQAR